MSVFKFDKDIAKYFFCRKIIINPRIILQMSRSTTNVLEAVQKTCSKSEMARHFIGVYIINSTLDVSLEIKNFSSCVEKYSLVCQAHS